MDCVVKIKVLNKLKKDGILSNTREILDFEKFDKINEEYTKHAIDQYGLPTGGKLLFDTVQHTVTKERGNRLRTGSKTIFRAEANNKLFDLLEAIIIDYEANHSLESQSDQSNTPTKEGVDFAYEQSPELANIGTPEQYSQYLDTIFPDSKVKDIVYHGTKSENDFEQYRTSEKKFKNGDSRIGFYFTKEKGYAEEFGKVIPNIINTINPIKINEEINFGEVRKYQDKNDAVIGIDDASEILVGQKVESYVVFEPEQIHILGSKQDMEGFQTFINGNMSLQNEIYESIDFNELLDNSREEILNELDPVEFSRVDNSDSTENVNISILFNGKDSGTFQARDVLSNIVENYGELTDGVKDITDKLFPILERSNAKVKFVSSSSLESDNTLMEYNANTNEIRVSKEKLDNISEEHAIRTFLHETIHSVIGQAYLKPESIDQKIFADFIIDMYDKYKELSGYTESDALTEGNYGFTNPMEFMAEIMTNPEFQAEIKSLEKGSLWNQIVDFIRSLIGLKKTSDYNSIIDSITTIAKESDYRSGLNIADNIFEKKQTEESEKFDKDSLYYSIKNIEDHLLRTKNGILDTLENNIKSFSNIIKTIKDPTKLQEHSDKQQELLDQIKMLDDTRHWEAITMYTIQAGKNITSLQKAFNKEDLNKEGLSKTVNLYKKHLASNALLDDIQNLVSRTKYETTLPISKEELNELQDVLVKALGERSSLEQDFLSFNKRAGYNMLNNRENSREVLFNWKNKLRTEHKKLGIVENFESWFIDQIGEGGPYKEEFDNDVSEKALEITNDPSYDISTAALLANSALNINNDLIQVFNKIIVRMRNNIVQRNRTEAIKLQTLYEKFIKERGNKRPSVLYKNMYEKTKDGETIIKGKYSIKFKEEFNSQLEKYKSRLAQIKSEFGEHSDEANSYYSTSEFAKWKKDNLKIVREDGKNPIQVPSDKWLTDTSKMTKLEIQVLETARKALEDSNRRSFGHQSLISDPLFTAVYYKLPSYTKTDLERALEGNLKGTLRDKLHDLTQIRGDDIGYEGSRVDSDSNPILNVRLHYRGKLEADQQSLDLFTLIAAETYNGISYSEKFKAESEAEVIKDIAKGKKYYKSGGFRIPFVGVNIGRNKIQEKKGIDSNVYKKIKYMMESNIYDIMHKNIGKVGKVDLNKALGLVNSWTGMIGMSVNEVAGAVNVLNGKAQMWMEAFGGQYITAKAIVKSEKIYFSDMGDTLKDVNKPVSTSFTNQVLEMFDTFGSVSASVSQAFIKNTIMKTNLNASSLQVLQDTGEHWMQSVLTMSILETIKVMDKNGKFLNKKGEIVESEKDAASILDMLKKDKNGVLQLDNKVVFTTHTTGVEYNKGGREMLTLLVKKKVFDTAGNYDVNTQPEAMRHAYGKIFGMYRKYFVPFGIARFRGFNTVDKKIGDLDSHQLFFSDALQDYETGTYTETVRFIINSGVIPALKKMQFDIMTSRWNELTPTQKKQIHKAIVEVSITSVLLPAMAMLFTALQSGDEGDDDYTWYLLFVNRRLMSELSSFRDINEQWRLINSPVPSMQVLQGVTDVASRLFSPTRWSEEYETGPNKGTYKFKKDFTNLIPVIRKFNTDYKRGFNFVENMAKN